MDPKLSEIVMYNVVKIRYSIKILKNAFVKAYLWLMLTVNAEVVGKTPK
jgi:hypothetical protein